MRRVESLIYGEIAARRARPDEAREDVLSLLLAARKPKAQEVC